MYASQLEVGQVYRLDGLLYRVVEQDGWPRSVNIENGCAASLGPGVEVELVEGEVRERQEVCEQCGERRPVSQLTRRNESYYDWDNPDEDAQGSVLLTRVVWTCRDTNACRTGRRIAGLAMLEQPDNTYQRGIGQGWGEME
jgi:hypothetical protein